MSAVVGLMGLGLLMLPGLDLSLVLWFPGPLLFGFRLRGEGVVMDAHGQRSHVTLRQGATAARQGRFPRFRSCDAADGVFWGYQSVALQTQRVDRGPWPTDDRCGVANMNQPTSCFPHGRLWILLAASAAP